MFSSRNMVLLALALFGTAKRMTIYKKLTVMSVMDAENHGWFYTMQTGSRIVKMNAHIYRLLRSFVTDSHGKWFGQRPIIDGDWLNMPVFVTSYGQSFNNGKMRCQLENAAAVHLNMRFNDAYNFLSRHNVL